MFGLWYSYALVIAHYQVYSHTIRERAIESDAIVTVFDNPKQNCSSALGLNETVIQEALTEDFKFVVGNEQINEYVACVWKNYGFLQEDGNIDVVTIQPFVEFTIHARLYDRIEEGVLKNCGNVSSVSQNGTAVKVHNCIIDYLSSTKHDVVNFFTYPPNEKCLSELGLARAVAEEISKTYLKVAEGNDQINKYMNCLWKDLGWLTEDGAVDTFELGATVAYRALGSVDLNVFDEVVFKILRICSGHRGNSTGDKAVKFYNCMISFINNRTLL